MHPFETGGVLLGYVSDKDIVVADVLGPGPAALHERRNFEPDHLWHQAEIARRFHATEGRVTYLGDWHTHPDAMSARLSGQDKAAISRVIRSREARTPRPVSVILFGGPDDWRLAAWRCSFRRTWLPLLRTEPLLLRSYAED